MTSKPTIMVEYKGGNIQPQGPWDAELLEEFSEGSMFELKVRSRRSNPQNNYYWAALTRICKATGLYPSSRHLHEELLLATGHYSKRASLSGGVRDVPDRTAFDKMKHHEFTVYFDQAKLVLLEHGIDIEVVMGRETT